jgi:hypothetical protein
MEWSWVMLMCWCLVCGSQCGEHVDDDVRKRSRHADDGGDHKPLHQKDYTFEKKQLSRPGILTHTICTAELSYRAHFQSFHICHNLASPTTDSPPAPRIDPRRSSTPKHSQHAFLLLQSSCLGRCPARHGCVPDTEGRISKGASAKDLRGNTAEMKGTTATVVCLEARQAPNDVVSSCFWR